MYLYRYPAKCFDFLYISVLFFLFSFSTSCIVSCFVLKYFCENFTCTCPSFLKNIFRSHDAWPGFFIFEGLTCIMPVNCTQKLVLYMSATAKASEEHVPLRHALDCRLGVDDLTVRACHSGHARTTLVDTSPTRAGAIRKSSRY